MSLFQNIVQSLLHKESSPQRKREIVRKQVVQYYESADELQARRQDEQQSAMLSVKNQWLGQCEKSLGDRELYIVEVPESIQRLETHLTELIKSKEVRRNWRNSKVDLQQKRSA